MQRGQRDTIVTDCAATGRTGWVRQGGPGGASAICVEELRARRGWLGSTEGGKGLLVVDCARSAKEPSNVGSAQGATAEHYREARGTRGAATRCPRKAAEGDGVLIGVGCGLVRRMIVAGCRRGEHGLHPHPVAVNTRRCGVQQSTPRPEQEQEVQQNERRGYASKRSHEDEFIIAETPCGAQCPAGCSPGCDTSRLQSEGLVVAPASEHSRLRARHPSSVQRDTCRWTITQRASRFSSTAVPRPDSCNGPAEVAPEIC